MQYFALIIPIREQMKCNISFVYIPKTTKANTENINLFCILYYSYRNINWIEHESITIKYSIK